MLFQVERSKPRCRPGDRMSTLLPHKQQNQKQLHPIGCALWTPMLRFERPENFSFSLRGTSFFCSPRFLPLTSETSSRKPGWSPEPFFCYFSHFRSFLGP